MFNFFRKKSKKEIENIKNFKEAIKTINFFIATFEWEKAQKAIDEILGKELKAYKEIINNIEEEDNPEIYKLKEDINKKHIEKQKKLEILKVELEEKRKKYENKIKEDEFNVQLKLLKKEVKNLSHTGKTYQAINLIKDFISEHEANPVAIKYYNVWKKKLEKIAKKDKLKKEKKLKENVKVEALRLIGEEVIQQEEEVKEKKDFLSKLREKFNFYKLIKRKIKEKELLNEVEILINEENELKQKIASSKIEKMHKGLVKELNENMLGYDFYGKILGAHKISGDTFGFNENKEKFTFFIGDATGHGIKAGFIITLLTRIFNKLAGKKTLKELVFEINNSLKQDLKSMNFITSIFFEVIKSNLNKINFVGLGHEPMLVYREKTKKIEKIIPGGLAAGIRIIKDIDSIHFKNVVLENGDILVTYSDGLLEAKSPKGEYYGLEKFIKDFQKIIGITTDTKKIYEHIIESISDFRKGTAFDDDLTVLLLKRNTNKDVVNKDEIEKLSEKYNVDNRELKKFKGKTKEEIVKEIEKIKKQKELELIIKKLKQLWLSGEILTLKEEAKRYIKEGFIHTKINYYFRKALEHQQKYKISLKEERIKNKYNALNELLKKGDYDTVIREAQDIILKDGNL